jgi:hypothetical protein
MNLQGSIIEWLLVPAGCASGYLLMRCAQWFVVRREPIDGVFRSLLFSIGFFFIFTI